jgi:putative membrane protein
MRRFQPTSFRLAYNEFLRFTSGRLPKLALAALVLVPLLYGAMYIYANWDPYNRLDNVPVALVNADNGAKDPNGKQLNAGDKIVQELKRSGNFDWHEVSAEDATRGVTDGDYTFALTLPADFSASLVSSADFSPQKGRLGLTTNDANNYLVRTIANKVVGEVRDTVARQVGTKAAERLLTGFSTVHDQLAKATKGTGRLADGASDLNAGQQELLKGTNDAKGGAAELSSGLSTLQSQTADLPDQTATLASGAREVADGNDRVSAAADRAAEASSAFANSISGVNGSVAQRLRAEGFSSDEIATVNSALAGLRGPVQSANNDIQDAAGKLGTLAGGARKVADGADALAGSAPALSSGINRAADGASTLDSGLTRLQSGQQKAAQGSGDLLSGTQTLRKNLQSGLGGVPNPDADQRAATARNIGDPIAVRSTGQANASTYGAGLAPFFLGLAAWVGGFVLFLLFRPLSNRAIAAGRSALSVAVGGVLTPAAVGVAQMIVLYGVVTLAVGVHPAAPISALGFLIFASLSFVALLHGLNAWLGPVGKFLGLILLILQLISAGGTFPWQTIPVVLYPLHAVLPMSYVVDGLRHLLYGGNPGGVLVDLLVLAVWMLVGLAMAVFAAGRNRIWTPARLKPELAL